MRSPRWWRTRNRSWWWSTTVVVVPIVLLTGLSLVVLTPVIDPPDSAARLELIKVALAVGAGTGAALTLVLARRRQWATEHDAAERRLTELYLKAVEHLGSDQAAVRHGGLHALERVAQDNPDHRQTVVDVICAYLRAPFTPPSTPSSTPRLGRRAGSVAPASDRNHRRQEQEVRRTAQRVLARHLRPRGDHGERLDTFWPDIDLDLTAATLVDFDLETCEVRDARFRHTLFIGTTGFNGTRFTRFAFFNESRFTGVAGFGSAEFTGHAWFDDARFNGRASFFSARFLGHTLFTDARFSGDAWFDKARFEDYVSFAEATFARGVPAEIARLLD